jgi:hypothetical protein
MRRSSHSVAKLRTYVLSGILILASITFTGAVLGFNLFHRPPAIDNETLCRKDIPLEHHTVLLIDATDSFTRDQAARLRASVAEERAQLPKFGKFSVLFVSPKTPFAPETIISLCNPGSGPDADPLFSNPIQIERFWEQKFAHPIDAAVDRLLNAPSAARSPILESITATTWRHDFDERVPHRRMRIISDLLQHEPGGYSQYQPGDPWKRFLRTALAKKVNAELTGVVVSIDYLRRPGALQYQNEAHRKFWEQWLTQRGAVSVDFGGSTPTVSPTESTKVIKQAADVKKINSIQPKGRER